MEERTFILGLGSQKSGTSWLFDYLASSGTVATHFIKEYHVWDAIHVPGVSRLLVTKEESELNSESRVRFFLQQSPENYFIYFSYMMNQQGKKVTCDITPLYSGLNRGVLRMIKEGFERRGVSTRAVFLMRDPVERCWSAARMDSRIEFGHTRISEEDVLARALSKLTGLRTRYDITVGEMEAVFEPSSMFFGLYEEMFDSENLSKLSEFCLVPTRQSQAEKKVNVSEVATPISDAAYAKIASHYRGVYEFAAKRFPRTTELWKGYRYL